MIFKMLSVRIWRKNSSSELRYPAVGVIRSTVYPTRLSGRRAVIVSGDVVEPGDDLALLIGFLHGEVRHESGGGHLFRCC